jgi:hypothetical protein
VGTFEGLLEEVTQYKESERLLADPAAASGDMAIAEGLTFTNKAASGLHWASVKVGGSCPEHALALRAATSPVMFLCIQALLAVDHANTKLAGIWTYQLVRS